MARFYRWLQAKEMIKPYKGKKRITEPNQWSNTWDLYEFLKGKKRCDVIEE